QRFFTLVDGSPFRYVDAGRLANAPIVERMTLFSGELGQRYGYFPRMSWRLLGEPWTPGQAGRLGPISASVRAACRRHMSHFITAPLRAGPAVIHGGLAPELFDPVNGDQR